MKADKVRVRMAPSPTGEFHIGGMRTLLYNWAFAKKKEGEFIIRIEDTDRERYVEGAIDRLLAVIADYGLSWDEGPLKKGQFGPYVQSERLQIYKKYIDELVEKGAAYHCFCSPERLNEMRKEQQKKGVAVTKYDRRCLSLSDEEINKKLEKNQSFVVRLKMPDNEEIVFEDEIYGEIKFNSNDLDDQILLKSDGFPTYHFAVVVDDHLMEVTHVMRGNEWLPSTPKHVILYDTFGWERPVFVHLPNLKEKGQNKKMSKRFGNVHAKAFLNEGYLPEAVLNFLMFLGWNPGTEKEMYSLDEFIADFSIEHINKTDLVVFDRDKLLWMNSQYISKMDVNELAARIYNFYNGKYDKKIIAEVVPYVNTRIKKISEYAEIAGFIHEKPKVDKKKIKEEDYKHLRSAISVIESLEKWELESLNERLMSEISKNGYKTGKFFMSLRYCLSGQSVTPPINESMIILGREEVLSRLSAVLPNEK